MGIRTLKNLFLNGIAVGQYLGSDDPEEDQRAALEALRDKGIYKPPTIAQAMRGQAVGFARAASLAYREFQHRSPADPPTTMVPFIVNAAFAAELYLKTLLYVAYGVMPKRDHRLVALHAKLPVADQVDLETLCAAHTAEHDPGTAEAFAARLVPFDDAFRRWRYAYESDRVGPLRNRSLILVLKALHERCQLVV